MRNRSSSVERVHVVLELRQLRRAGHRRAIHDDRHPHLLVAVLARVHVEHEVHAARATSRAPAPRKTTKPEPADLRAAREVEDAERARRSPSAAGRPSSCAASPHSRTTTFALFAALGNVGERDVRNLEQDARRAPPPTSASSRFEARDLFAERARLRDQLVGALAAPSCGARLPGVIALRAAFRSSTAWMSARRSRSSASRTIEQRAELVELAARRIPSRSRSTCSRSSRRSCMASDQDSGIDAGSEATRKPQFGLPTATGT